MTCVTRAQIVTLLYRQLTKEILKNRVNFWSVFRQHRTIQRAFGEKISGEGKLCRCCQIKKEEAKEMTKHRVTRRLLAVALIPCFWCSAVSLRLSRRPTRAAPTRYGYGPQRVCGADAHADEWRNRERGQCDPFGLPAIGKGQGAS